MKTILIMILMCTSVCCTAFDEYETNALCQYAGYASLDKDKFMSAITIRMASMRGDSVSFNCGSLALMVIKTRKMPDGYYKYRDNFYVFTMDKLFN